MFRWILLACFLVLTFVAPACAVTIAVGGETFLVETFPISAAVVDTTPFPLAIDVDVRSGNTIYMLAEFDRRIYSLARTATNGTTLTTIDVPAPGSPLFRAPTGSVDTGSFISQAGEHLMTTADGSVWFSQGGLLITSFTGNNWSRIMRRKLDGTFEAFTLPVDSAGVIGFNVRGPTDNSIEIWAGAFTDNAFYYTRYRAWHEGELSATRYPPADTRWTKLRTFGIGRGGFNAGPAQVQRLSNGNLIGLLYWDTSFFFFDPRTQAFTDVSLTYPVTAGLTAGSSGPAQVRQHPDGNLWITEEYAKRVTKYNLVTGAQTLFDLTASLDSTEFPQSLVVDGTDLYITTYNTGASSTAGRLVKITNAGVVTVGTSFATISLGGGLAGIARDSTGALWVCLFQQKAIARLTRQ